MSHCRLCNLRVPMPNGLCVPCMDTLAVDELPPPRRRPVPCQKCNGVQFVRVLPRLVPIRDVEANTPAPWTQPLALSQDLVRGRRSGGFDVYPPTGTKPLGILEAYTCLGCGFVEWYVNDPTEIPIGPEHRSELIDYSGGGPYR